MNKDLEKYYSVYSELFRTEGWKQLQTELRASFETTNSVEGTSIEGEHLSFRKGQLDVLSNLIKFEDSMSAAQEAAEKEAEVVSDEEEATEAGEAVEPLEA